MVKSLALAMLMLITGLMPLVPMDEHSTSLPETRYISAPSGLNFRAEPRLDAQKLGVIPFAQSVRSLAIGAPLEVGGKQGAWEEVEYQGQRGYVFNVYLSVLPVPQTIAGLDAKYCQGFIEFGHEPLLTKYVEQYLTPVSESVILWEADPNQEENFSRHEMRRYDRGTVVFSNFYYEWSQTHLRVIGMHYHQAEAWVNALVQAVCPEQTYENIQGKVVKIDHQTVEIIMESGV